MLAICFHWSPPNSISDNERASRKLVKHWTHTAKCFGIDTIYCIGTPPTINDAEITFNIIDSVDELNGELIYVEQGGINLKDFKHPKSCTYIFGSDYNGLPKADISIDCDLGLYAEQACAIVLYDRHSKCL